MDPRILELVRTEPRFAYEAYEFVCDAVSFTQEKLGRAQNSDDAADDECDRHVSGAELLRGACDLAIREFGLMAPVVFRMWGIRTTDDFGDMVFRLIRAERLSKSDQDDIDDFHDLFDLEKALTERPVVELDTSRRADR